MDRDSLILSIRQGYPFSIGHPAVSDFASRPAFLSGRFASLIFQYFQINRPARNAAASRHVSADRAAEAPAAQAPANLTAWIDATARLLACA